MKKVFKLIGTQGKRFCAIALLAAITLFMMTCDNGTTNSVVVGDVGILTINDLPTEYNGKFITFHFRQRGNDVIMGGLPFQGSVTISNGKASIPLHNRYTDDIYTWDETIYSYEDVYIFARIWEPSNYNVNDIDYDSFSLPSVTFTNGSATISFKDRPNATGGDEWSNKISPLFVGAWSYMGEIIFTIEANGKGSIGGQDGYSVQQRGIPRAVRFTKGNTVVGEFECFFNGDAYMWIRSGTGPFAAWANVGPAGRECVIIPAGAFTITDIPSQYNGKYTALWAVWSGNHVLMGCKSQDSTSFTLPQISNGKVSIPLWEGSNKWTDTCYGGNVTYITNFNDDDNRIFVKLVDNEIIPVSQSMNEPGDAVFFSTVKFSRGSATQSYKDRLLF